LFYYFKHKLVGRSKSYIKLLIYRLIYVTMIFSFAIEMSDYIIMYENVDLRYNTKREIINLQRLSNFLSICHNLLYLLIKNLVIFLLSSGSQNWAFE
jgi:hypothetical protein